MEKITQHLDDTLLRYLDGALNTMEKQSLEEELKHNEALKNRLNQLQMMNLALQNSKLEQPSKNFTQLVMSKLDQYPLPARSFSIRNGILLLVGVLVAVGIASVLVSYGVFDSATTTIDLNQVEFPKKYIERTLPSIPFNGKLIVNVIILLNLGLAWLVLDRAILRPLFQRRMQAGH
jgi:anti-sigma factor RsiW